MKKIIPLLLLAVTLCSGCLGLGPTPTEEPTLAPTPTEEPTPALGDTLTRTKDGMVMVGVPAGEFPMGSTQGFIDEQPVHTVYVDGFWIDKTEMTNEQFAAFLNEKGNQEEGGAMWLNVNSEDCLIEQVGGKYQPKSGYANHPVVGVTWYGAARYCEWAGARLPTEAEWEYAARGPEGRGFPWGDEFDCKLCNSWGGDCDGYDRTAPVGSFPAGASWCGALDMLGNVWEWVADWYDAGYYANSPPRNPTGPSSGMYRVQRGGSWYSGAHTQTSPRWYRGYDIPNLSYNYLDFRCASDSR
jgi:formylglycine-generating enzyme required for sulfatase activity